MDKLDTITNKNFFLSDKSCLIESKSRIYIIKLDITKKKFYLSTLYKKDLNIFKTEILNIASFDNTSSPHGVLNISTSSSQHSIGNLNSSSTSGFSNINNTNFNMNLTNLNTFDSFKNLEFLKELIIAYSEITENYYFAILNKIFVIENSIHEFSNSDKDFIVKEKIYKNFPISFLLVEDPYIFIFMDNKIQVHFCLDLKKPLEIITLENPFSLSNNKLTHKQLNKFFKETKANLYNDLIEYNDVFLMNKLRASRGNEYILNSCQHLLLIFDNKNFWIDWIYSKNHETQFSILKKVNFIFSCKYLGYFSKLLNQIIKEETENKNYENIVSFVKSATTVINLPTNNNTTLNNNNITNFNKLISEKNNNNMQINSLNNKSENYSISVKNNLQAEKNINFNLDLFKSFYFPSDNFINILNEKFLLKNSIILFYSLISIKDYAKAKLLLEEVKLDKIFIMILLKNFVNSKRILVIMDQIIKKISILENIHFLIHKSYSDNNGFLSEVQNQNQILIFKERFAFSESIDIQLPDLVEATLIKTEKDLAIFLKGFFNTLIFYRNDLKIYLNKYRRKSLDGETIIKKFFSEIVKKNKSKETSQTIIKENIYKRKSEIDTLNEDNLEEELNFVYENENSENEEKNNSHIKNQQERETSNQNERLEDENIKGNPSELKNIVELDKSEISNNRIIDLDNLDFDKNLTNDLINKLLQSEIELRYLLIENLIFVCNYYSFKNTANQKYSENLKLMIKISHNILEKEFINLLQNSDLDEEILLFYYYKGNYSKCLNKIVSIYDSLEKIELQKDFSDRFKDKQKFDYHKYENIQNFDLHSNDSRKNIEFNESSIDKQNISSKININIDKNIEENVNSTTIINISKAGIHSARLGKKSSCPNFENLKNLKNFSKEIAFENLGYDTNIEKNISFINKEALLENNEENDIENIINSNINTIQINESSSIDANQNNAYDNTNISENIIKINDLKNNSLTDDYNIKIDDSILKKNPSNLNLNKSQNIKENLQLKNIDRIKSQWFIRYINLINLISPKIQKIELMEYMKWALSKNAYKTIDILFENNIISKTKIENDFLDILKPFGIDSVIYYLKFILGNNKIEEPTHQNEIINLYTLKLKLLYESLEKEDPLISDYNEHFKDCKNKIKSNYFIYMYLLKCFAGLINNLKSIK